MAEDFGSFWSGAQNAAPSFGTPNFSDWWSAGGNQSDPFGSYDPNFNATSPVNWGGPDPYSFSDPLGNLGLDWSMPLDQWGGAGGMPDWATGGGVRDLSNSTEFLPGGSMETGGANSGNGFWGNVASGAGSLPWDKILGGAAGLGLAGGLLTNNKGGNSSESANLTQTQQLPPWWEDGAMQGVAEAGSIPGYESQLDTPGTLLRNTDINQYMNPYLQQTLDPVLRNMDIEQAGEQNQLAANAAKVGAFGGSRPALDQSLALERQGRRRDEAVGTAYRGAYDNAQTGALADIGRTWDDIGVRYKDPYNQTGALGDMLSKTKTDGNISRTSGSTQQAAKENPWKTLAGAGFTGLGLYNELKG